MDEFLLQLRVCENNCLSVQITNHSLPIGLSRRHQCPKAD